MSSLARPAEGGAVGKGKGKDGGGKGGGGSEKLVQLSAELSSIEASIMARISAHERVSMHASAAKAAPQPAAQAPAPQAAPPQPAPQAPAGGQEIAFSEYSIDKLHEQVRTPEQQKQFVKALAERQKVLVTQQESLQQFVLLLRSRAKGKRKPEAAAADEAEPAKRQANMCKLFIMGGCPHGDGCPDIHAHTQEEAEAIQRERDRRKAEEEAAAQKAQEIAAQPPEGWPGSDWAAWGNGGGKPSWGNGGIQAVPGVLDKGKGKSKGKDAGAKGKGGPQGSDWSNWSNWSDDHANTFGDTAAGSWEEWGTAGPSAKGGGLKGKGGGKGGGLKGKGADNTAAAEAAGGLDPMAAMQQQAMLAAMQMQAMQLQGGACSAGGAAGPPAAGFGSKGR